MLINTESNILMFQFENINWQYSLERPKQKKNKDKEEDREENSFTEVLSKCSTQVYSPGDSISSKQRVAPEALLTKPHRTRVLLKSARLSTGKRADSQPISAVPGGAGDGRPGLVVSVWDIFVSGFMMI